MKYVLSTIAWVESIAKKEIERQGWVIENVIDRVITFSGGEEMIPRMNLWSRVWNKVYMLLAEEENVTDFDTLFDIVKDIKWRKYFKKDFPIVVKTSTTRSDLFASRTIQSLGKKAIIKSLVWNTGTVNENDDLENMEILLLLVDNKLRVLLNTSGNALHMRGYRTEAWEAPIKESLAAALVLLWDWRFKDNFYDPFCGSWTIAIEALMIAKNMAPGLKRKFAFEKLGLVDPEITANERELAKTKTFDWDYSIRASDIDPEMIEIAKENAARAWVAGEINFEVKDFMEYLDKDLYGTMVSNPPYGERLKDENIKGLYNNIDKLFRIQASLGGGIISSYLDFDNQIKKDTYKKRKLYNGWEKCYFWRKK